MSISNFNLISGSLGLIGVLAETETATAEMAAQGLTVLNEMMEEWKANGIDLQYYEQTSQAEDTPIPDSSITPVKYYLAFALAPYYNRPIDSAMVTLAEKSYSRLQREAMVDQLKPSSLENVPRGAGRGWFSILN